MANVLEKVRAADFRSIAIVAAHPDDETIGAGAQMARWKNVSLIHVTDGSPRDLADARAAGFNNATDYAAARLSELRAAIHHAQNGDAILLRLGFPDQEVAFQLGELVRRLFACLRELNPEFVLTHPFEGGHPDHDATAFGVHLACERLCSRHDWRPGILEMTSYHARDGQMRAGTFLRAEERPVLRINLDEAQRSFKQALFDCFKTQRGVLRQFALDEEKFREAPRYDFTKPPGAGEVYYERFDWGIRCGDWCRLASQALVDLGDWRSAGSRVEESRRC